MDLGICWREFELGSRAKDQYRGHRFVGGFGHGGQDIHMVSWSYEVVLVGRVETRFGQCLTQFNNEQPDRWGN
jgi:hypothetical protein